MKQKSVNWPEPGRDPFLTLKLLGFISRVWLFSSQTCLFAWLLENWTLNDLQSWVCMHFSWHSNSNSSPTRTELMLCPTKAWPGTITKIPEGLVHGCKLHVHQNHDFAKLSLSPISGPDGVWPHVALAELNWLQSISEIKVARRAKHWCGKDLTKKGILPLVAINP